MFRHHVHVLACLSMLVPGLLMAQDAPKIQTHPELGPPVTPYHYDGDVSKLAAPAAWKPGDPIRHIPKRFYAPEDPPEARPRGFGVDPLSVAQLSMAGTAESGRFAGSDPTFTTPETNFLAHPYNGVGVPDTVGAVGPDHLVHMVNGTTVRIWDKAMPQPNQLASFNISTIGSGVCTSGGGDPIALYDRLADRWLISEFASGNTLCVYISKTPSPVTGGWYNYEFSLPFFPDYPKYAIWPTDANGGDGSYVVTANDGGPGVIALDRGRMIQGLSASFQRFSTGGLPGFGFQAITPADSDGPNGPPSGTPAVIMRHRDTEVHGGSAAGDLLEMWLFDVDWQIPSNSSLTQATSIDVAEFDSDLCGTFSFSCIQQPGGGDLDPIREAIMNRLQYFHHDDGVETLVGNLATDVTGSDDAGIRWFELRRSGGAWQLHQEGTYTIDSDSRWMGASSMDSSKNIALAYNVSSTSTFPALRYTGRLADDPLGVMTQSETSIVEGVTSQPFDRFGDYAAMGLDPTDDCTFWFTGEAVGNGGSWFTQWASFRFQACGCLLAPGAPAVQGQDLGNNRVEVSWNDADLPSVTEYTVQRSRTPAGPYETIAVIADTSPGTAGGAGYAFEDTGVSGGTTFYYVVLATDGLACNSTATNEIAVEATGLCTFKPLFGGIEIADTPLDSTCGIELFWSPAVSECNAGVVYNIYRSETSGFTPGPSNLIASGVSGNSLVDLDGLTAATQQYYVVRALDTVSLVEDDNNVEQTATVNAETLTLLDSDFEEPSDFATWTVGTGPGAHTCDPFERVDGSGSRPSGGSGFYALALQDGCPLFAATSTFLDSPVMDGTQTGVQSVELSFDLYYNPGGGADATVEAFDGSTWQVVWSDTNALIDQRLTLDVSSQAVGNPNFRVRFNYQDAVNDDWYSLDNVLVTADAAAPCSTGQSPAPVPDGSAGTTALLGDRLDVPGGSIGLTWDAATCSSTTNNLIYGSLGSVASYVPGGSVCSIGTTGAFTWNGVPAGDLYFLIVGTDGAAIESSWGQSVFGERGGLTSSGQCGVTAKAVSATCP